MTAAATLRGAPVTEVSGFHADGRVDVVVLVPDAGRLVVSGVRLSEIEVWP